MVSKNLSLGLSVSLSVTNFDLNYFRTGEIELAEIKQVRRINQGKQHSNERMRVDKIPTIRGNG